MSEKITLPNQKPTRIPKFNNISIEKTQSLFEIIYGQINDAFYCYYIGSRLFDDLNPISEKVDLNKKWYIFALNSLDNNMNLILDKLYDEADNSHSLINILKHYSISENYENICNTEGKKKQFQFLIEEYNKEYSLLRKNLIKRRSGWHAHFGNILFKKDFEQKILLSNKDCENLLYFARKTIRKLYHIVTDKFLPCPDNYLSQLNEIDKFVSSLDNKGNLK